MKKGAIARLIIWSVTAFILIGMLVVGIVFGPTGGVFNVSDWSFSIGIGGNRYYDSEKYTVGSGSVTDEINSIEINWISGKVSVEGYEGDTIEISETPVSDEDYQLRYLSENGKLIIQYMKSGWMFGIQTTHNKQLTLKVPYSVISNLSKLKIDVTSAGVNVASANVAETITIDNVSGKIQLKDVSAAKCDIDTVSGAVTATNLKTDIFECDTISGDIVVSGEIGKVDTDSTSGDVNITSTTCPSSVEADSVSGDIILNIPENSGFTAEIDSVSGDFESDFAVILKSGKRICGDGKADFEFDTVSGDVIVNKLF